MRPIKLAYVRENFPYVAKCSVQSRILTGCHEPGIASEIWLQFARHYNYTLELIKASNYGVTYKENGVMEWNGLIGLLVNGSADASLSLLSPNEDRYRDVIFGPVLTTYDMGFIYGLPSESQNILVRVFDQYTVLIILLVICVCAAVYSISHGMLDGWWSVLAASTFQNDVWVRLFNPVLLLGFLFINFMYFAGYRSQAISISWRERPFTDIQYDARNKLATGRLKLIVEDSTLLFSAKTVYDNDRVFERNPPIVESNYDVIGQLLCTDATAVYYGNVAPMSSIWFFKPPCPIKRLEYDDPLTRPTYLSFTISKKFPKRELFQLTQFIDVAFNFEVVNSRWANIYHSRYSQSGGQTLEASAIHFNSLGSGFRLFCIGLSIAIVCFLCEICLAACISRRRIRIVRRHFSLAVEHTFSQWRLKPTLKKLPQ